MNITRGRRLSLGLVFAAVLSASAAPAAAAATVAVVDGTVVFTASNGEVNDVSAHELVISDAGAPVVAGDGCEPLDAHTVSCPEPPFADTPLTVETGDLDDRVALSEMCCRQVIVRGGFGDDALSVASHTGAPVELDGGPGDDDLLTNEQLGGAPVLRGGGGDDTLRICCETTVGGLEYGGPGNDRLEWRGITRIDRFPLLLDGGVGNDTYSFPILFVGSAIAVGWGFDTLDQSEGYYPLDFDMGSCPGCVQRVIGTSGADRIVGDGRPQAIFGGDGDDALDGGGGPDALSGQGGDDAIEARDGTIDAITCDGGTDSVFADRFDPVSRSCEIVRRGRGV